MDVNHYTDITIQWISTYSLKLVAALLIFVIGRWLAKKLTALLAKLMRKNKVDETLIGFFDSIAYYTLLLVVLIAAPSSSASTPRPCSPSWVPPVWPSVSHSKTRCPISPRV